MSDRRRIRISLRAKLLGLLGSVLLVAMATYLGLAVALIHDDRLAYAFDLNQRVASTLSSQARAALESAADRLTLFGGLAVREADETVREALGRQLLDSDPDLVRVRLYRRSREGRLVRSAQLVAWERLKPLELSPSGLDDIDRTTSLPLEAAGHGHLVVLNRSLPPAAQLVSIVVADPAYEPASWVVAADLTPNRLQEIFAASALYRAYLVDAEGVAITHPDATVVVGRTKLARVPVVNAALSEMRAQSGALEFTDAEGRAMLGAWARVRVGRLAVVAETDRDVALAAIGRLVRLSALFGIAILLAAFLASIFFSRMLTRPLSRLSAATRELAQGRYDVKIDVTSGDEIGALAADFRTMAQEIRDGQARLIQSEKMAAFGQLGAGITHEVKNPLAAMRGFAQLALHYIDDKTQVHESLEMVEREADRCLGILQNFLAFARQDPGHRVHVGLNDLVANSIKLIAHQLGTSGTKLHQNFGKSPVVHVAAGQMQQVVLNLLLNAQQALGRGGNVWVSTRTLPDGSGEIEIRDDGPGIPAEIRTRIFEPFFTTKAAEKGTGLGLSVSYKIVSDHGGELSVESQPGQGATFRVRLPPAAADVAPEISSHSAAG